MLSNYIGHKGFTLRSGGFASSFDDAYAISSWAAGAVAEVQGAGIIAGKPWNLFDPQGLATRAEVATIFTRFIEAR